VEEDNLKIFFKKQKVLIVIFFILMASMFYLKYDDQRAEYLKIVILIYAIIYLITRLNSSVKIPKYFFTLLVFIGLGIMSALLKGNIYGNTIFYIQRFIQWLVISIIIYEIFSKLNNPKKIFYSSWVILVGISDLILIITLLRSDINIITFLVGNTNINRYMGVFFVNVGAALYSAISIYFVFIILSNYKIKYLVKILLVLVICMNIFSIIVQGTRSGLILLFLLFFINFLKTKFNLQKVIIYLIVLMIFLPIIFYFFSQSEIVIFERFRKGITLEEESFQVRMLLAKAGLNLFIKNPVFGVGPDNFRNFTYLYALPEIYSHSMYIEILANYGILGFICFFYFLVLTYKKSNSITYTSANTLWISLMVMMIISAGYFLQPYFWIVTSFIWAESKANKNNE